MSCVFTVHADVILFTPTVKGRPSKRHSSRNSEMFNGIGVFNQIGQQMWEVLVKIRVYDFHCAELHNIHNY
jgi:hypothetical protein